ncbi:MAG: Ig-like domain-containing protein, partial [Clostridia bacterium]|nr:Ig-like domain-containing protein [Clostridia bacterium]
MKKMMFRALSLLLALLTLLTSVGFAVSAEEEGTRINNDDIGEGLFQVSYNCYWPYDFERWITKDYYPADKAPSFTIRFEGTKISLYAHKNQSGGMAEVTIDGEVAGEIDYYLPERKNGQLLFASNILPEGEHTLTVRLTQESNPEANGNLEAAFEYAVVENVEAVEATSITLDYETLEMVEGATRVLGYTLEPANAAVGSVTFESSASDVVSVDGSGKVTANAVGSATVTVSVDGTTLSDSVVITVIEEPADEDPLRIDHDEIGEELYQVSYNCYWPHDSERWITAEYYPDGVDPSFTIRFEGTKISLYAHKNQSGGMAEVAIDGEVAGQIDYYAPERKGGELLYESTILPEGEHTLTVRLTRESNPEATGDLECSFSHAIIENIEPIHPASIAFERESIVITTGSERTLTYTLRPEDVNVACSLIWESNDTDVVTVDNNGKVSALKEGEATVTVKIKDTDLSDSIKITVSDKVEYLSAMVGDEGVHRYADKYDQYLGAIGDSTEHPRSFSDYAWRGDTVNSRIDLLTKELEIKNAQIVTNEMVNEKGDKIPASAVTVTYMDAPLMESVYQTTKDKYPFDIISHDTVRTLAPESVYCAWVNIDIPKDAKPGIYTTTISIVAEDDIRADFEYTIEVLDLIQPALDHQLDLWSYPYSAQRYYSGKTSEEYFGAEGENCYYVHLDKKYEEAFRSQLALYAKAGGDVITATIVEDAWNSQTHDPYPSMIKWTR